MTEQDMILSKRNYHVAVQAAWRVYDEEVNPARIVRDDAMEIANSDEIADIWRKYNDDTLPARIKFETAIKPTRLLRDASVIAWQSARQGKLSSIEGVIPPNVS